MVNIRPLLMTLMMSIIALKSINAQCPNPVHPDYDALIALYDATAGPNWTNNTGWIDGKAGTNCDPCTWHGINCANNRVIAVSLTNNNLVGPIPPEIGNLTELQYLQLYENGLTGNIPSQLGNLNKLISCDFYSNQLDGNIPPSLGNMSAIVTLWLDNNNLIGSIPSSIGNLSTLKDLNLFGNQLTGSIPTTFSNLTSIIKITLSNNLLTGNIPDIFSGLTNLESLTLGNNMLDGMIPTSIGNLSALKILRMQENQLTGKIPDMFSNLTNLEQLYLDNNMLIGRIPPSIGDLNALMNATGLILNNNQLNGCYDTNLANLCLKNFTNFNISDGNNFDADWNPFCNQDDGICCFPPALTDLYDSTNGDGWFLRTGWFADCDPCGIVSGTPWYGIDCNMTTGDITKINLNNNLLTGTLPPSLAELTELEELILNFNMIGGTIPSEIGEMDNLFRLNLGDNNFIGNIPTSFSASSSMQFLYLQQNQLTGTIPPQLNSLIFLEQLLLYENQLTGSIPDLSSPNFLSILNLSDNNLTGPIPAGLSNKLFTLRLNNNNLTGPIPAYLGGLPVLDIFTAVDNNLSGCYDPALSSLCSGTVFLNNNALLPAAGDFSQFCNTDFGACNSPCDGVEVVTQDNPLVSGTRKYTNFIKSSGAVPNQGNVSFQVGNYTELLPNFNVSLGATFNVIIDDCSN